MSGFEVGKSYRVLPEFYDALDCCGYWYGKYKDSVFLVEEVDKDGCALSGGHFIAIANEFKYCEEVLESVNYDQSNTTKPLDYSKCLYASPEYLGYYVSFEKGGKKYFGYIVGVDKTSPQFSFLIDLKGFIGDENVATHDGFGLSDVKISVNRNTHWYVLLSELTFYQEDGSECSFDELT